MLKRLLTEIEKNKILVFLQPCLTEHHPTQRKSQTEIESNSKSMRGRGRQRESETEGALENNEIVLSRIGGLEEVLERARKKEGR